MWSIGLQRANLSRWRYGKIGVSPSPCWSTILIVSKANKCAGESKRAETEKTASEFVAREAHVYEEYWTAAWLRAESLWEERQDDQKYGENNKRNFAQQELSAMKTRYHNANLQGGKCKLYIVVKKEEVVGTLDLSIKHLSNGETFPGECLKHPLLWVMERKAKPRSSIRYAYIANLCVAKAARRKGVARRMLEFAISTAMADGAEKVFVHVHRHNIPARSLYHKIGFHQVVTVEQTYLLCLDVSSYFNPIED